MAVRRTPAFLIAALFSAASAGCTGGGDGYETVTPEKANQVVESHGGHHHGPNGGEIIEVGDHDIHAEVVYDADHHQITIHILGADASTAHPIAATELTLSFAHGDEVEEFKLAAVPVEGDAEGQASKFSLSSEDLLHELGEHKDGAKLTFSVDGKDYSGTVMADPHASHGEAGHSEHDEADHGKGDDDHEKGDSHAGDDEDAPKTTPAE
jgi:hypothetical protein